jgi:hypothetical protein
MRQPFKQNKLEENPLYTKHSWLPTRYQKSGVQLKLRNSNYTRVFFWQSVLPYPPSSAFEELTCACAEFLPSASKMDLKGPRSTGCNRRRFSASHFVILTPSEEWNTYGAERKSICLCSQQARSAIPHCDSCHAKLPVMITTNIICTALPQTLLSRGVYWSTRPVSCGWTGKGTPENQNALVSENWF